MASLDEDQAVVFGRLYRRAASDLNQAQTFVSGDATVRDLGHLVVRADPAIYGKPSPIYGASCGFSFGPSGRISSRSAVLFVRGLSVVRWRRLRLFGV